jgi:transposase-like protein
MPWKAMEEKIQFGLEYEQDNYTMSGLRQFCGITQDTVYVWLRRYRDRGWTGWWS